MQASRVTQELILELTELDAQLITISHQAKTLPVHAEIQQLMTQRQQIADELTAATTAVGDLEVAARKAEADLVPVRARIERNKIRAADGSVNESRALQVLLDEIKHLEERISTLEDAQLEVMEEAERAALTRDGLVQRQQEIEVWLREKVADRDEAVAALKDQAQSVVARRAVVAKQIPADLMKVYDRLRASLGSAAGRLVRGRCMGCQLELNVADLDALKKAPPEQLCRCPECDRILVREAS